MLKYVDLFDLGNKFVLVDLRGIGFKREGESKERNREGIGGWRGGKVKRGFDKRGDQRVEGNQSL